MCVQVFLYLYFHITYLFLCLITVYCIFGTLAAWCDIYSGATFICFFFIFIMQFYGWSDLYSGATYSQEDTVLDLYNHQGLEMTSPEPPV